MKKLLIANRGEIARRIIRTAHRLGISTVAVYAEADAHSLPVREASEAVALGGNASADSYLRVDKLIAAALATGADAVHPGYGFLSENADFAQAVVDAGLTWVGPPPAAIRALGNKASAKQLALAHGVPVLPGYQGADQSDACFVLEAMRVGYPLMVKATAGGGGRGMRLVTEAAGLLAALQSARSEALSGFGNADLLIERALLQPRHIELQVFADAHGHCIHLGERDCSVQRRHQKIIEESPSPAVDAALRARMGACAVALAQAAGYVGAGTVEFLLEGGQFYLMEMNTRLQVEHPVTEMRTGLDLVEWQLRIAQGQPLPLTQAEVTFNGHAIEVRLCAEDDHFTPHSGTIAALHWPPETQHLRIDHALEAGGSVPPFYDSMIAKIITHADTREAAIERLRTALGELRLLGLPSNRQFLRATLGHETFRAGLALIPFLTEMSNSLRLQLCKDELKTITECASNLLFNGKKIASMYSPFVRNMRLRHRGEVHSLLIKESREALKESPHHRTHAVQLNTTRWHVQVGAVDVWLDDASFEPASQGGAAAAGAELRAPFNGKVIRLAATVGQTVQRGDALVTLESMKLEHALCAARDGVVKAINVEVGQQVSTGQVLVVLG